jgi:hypothetical protein
MLSLHFDFDHRPSADHASGAREYGDVYSLILGTQPLIVLSSDAAVKELLDRRSNTYSDRMDMYEAPYHSIMLLGLHKLTLCEGILVKVFVQMAYVFS